MLTHQDINYFVDVKNITIGDSQTQEQVGTTLTIDYSIPQPILFKLFQSEQLYGLNSQGSST